MIAEASLIAIDKLVSIPACSGTNHLGKSPEGFLATFAKALLTGGFLGIVALVALGATVCGLLWGLGGPQSGSILAFFSGILLIALIYAIYWLWRGFMCRA